MAIATLTIAIGTATGLTTVSSFGVHLVYCTFNNHTPCPCVAAYNASFSGT